MVTGYFGARTNDKYGMINTVIIIEKTKSQKQAILRVQCFLFPGNFDDKELWILFKNSKFPQSPPKNNWRKNSGSSRKGQWELAQLNKVKYRNRRDTVSSDDKQYEVSMVVQ